MKLAGKQALVTGAQQGIGRAVALAMADADADVAIIVFLATDASRFITGEVVHANGGLYMA